MGKYREWAHRIAAVASSVTELEDNIKEAKADRAMVDFEIKYAGTSTGLYKKSAIPDLKKKGKNIDKRIEEWEKDLQKSKSEFDELQKNQPPKDADNNPDDNYRWTDKNRWE